MASYPLFSILTVVGILAELTLVAFLIGRRLYSAWPSLLALCVTDLLADGILSGVPRSSHAYYFTYYGSYFIAAGLRLWVLHDVLRSFPGSDFARGFLHWASTSVGAIMASGCWYFAATTSSHFPNQLRTATLYFDRCVSIAWGGFLVAALISIFASRLSWSRRGYLVAAGLSVRIATGMVVASLMSSGSPGSARTGFYVRGCSAIAVLAIWLTAFVRKDETIPPLSDGMLRLERRAALTTAH